MNFCTKFKFYFHSSSRWMIVILLVSLASLPLRASASVTISSFTAKWQGSQVVVSWVTATETNNAGFHVQRSTSSNGPFARITTRMINALNPGGVTGGSYSFPDTSVTVGQSYFYKLESIDLNGTSNLYPSIATPTGSATSTPTATRVNPTATRTSTGVPPTVTSTSTATFIPTRTPTYPPGVTPPTSTFTPPPTSTPTRTPTYPPGVTPPTPPPSATAQRIAAVPPVATVQRPASGNNSQNSSGGVSPSGATSTQDSLTNPDDAPDQVAQNDAVDAPASSENSELTNSLIRIGVVVTAGLLGLGAVVFGAIAVILFLCIPYNRL